VGGDGADGGCADAAAGGDDAGSATPVIAAVVTFARGFTSDTRPHTIETDPNRTGNWRNFVPKKRCDSMRCGVA